MGRSWVGSYEATNAVQTRTVVAGSVVIFEQIPFSQAV